MFFHYTVVPINHSLEAHLALKGGKKERKWLVNDYVTYYVVHSEYHHGPVPMMMSLMKIKITTLDSLGHFGAL